MSSISADHRGFHDIAPGKLGQLFALILGQAEIDGATRIKLHYGNNRMIYTIDRTDYEMVPLPSPSNVDLARAIAKASRTRWDKPGSLTVAFADATLDFTVMHHQDINDPYFEITGFTGTSIARIDEESERRAVTTPLPPAD